jgi:hypothetical protein
VPAWPRHSWKRDSFRVHKAAILRTIQRQTRADGCLFCPAFRWQRVRADVADLPEVIELGRDSLFEVKTSAINPKKALGIQPKRPPSDAGSVFRLDIAAQAAEPAPGPHDFPPAIHLTVTGDSCSAGPNISGYGAGP